MPLIERPGSDGGSAYRVPAFSRDGRTAAPEPARPRSRSRRVPGLRPARLAHFGSRFHCLRSRPTGIKPRRGYGRSAQTISPSPVRGRGRPPPGACRATPESRRVGTDAGHCVVLLLAVVEDDAMVFFPRAYRPLDTTNVDTTHQGSARSGCRICGYEVSRPGRSQIKR